MGFNLVFEILIVCSILWVLLAIIKAQRSIWLLKKKGNLGSSNLKVKLKVAKQKQEVLFHKEELANKIDSTLFSNTFNVIKQLLSLQKFLIRKQS